MQTGSPRSRNWRDIDGYDTGYELWGTEHRGSVVENDTKRLSPFV